MGSKRHELRKAAVELCELAVERNYLVNLNILDVFGHVFSHSWATQNIVNSIDIKYAGNTGGRCSPIELIFDWGVAALSQYYNVDISLRDQKVEEFAFAVEHLAKFEASGDERAAELAGDHIIFILAAAQDPKMFRYVYKQDNWEAGLPRVPELPSARELSSRMHLTPSSSSNMHNASVLSPEIYHLTKHSSEMQSAPKASSEMQSTPKPSSEMQSTPKASSEIQSRPKALSEMQSTPKASSEIQSRPGLSSETQSAPKSFRKKVLSKLRKPSAKVRSDTKLTSEMHTATKSFRKKVLSKLRKPSAKVRSDTKLTSEMHTATKSFREKVLSKLRKPLAKVRSDTKLTSEMHTATKSFREKVHSVTRGSKNKNHESKEIVNTRNAPKV